MNEIDEFNIDTIDIEYDPETVNAVLKQREETALENKLKRLELELQTSLNLLREQVSELGLDETLGKVKGNEIYFTRYKNGLKVFGEDCYRNIHLLKALEANGVSNWNPELKCWLFPYNRKESLKRMGICEQSEIC